MLTVSSVHSKSNLGIIEIPNPILDLDKFTNRIKNLAQNVTQANVLVKMVLYLRLWKNLVRVKKKLSKFEELIPLLKLETKEQQQFAESLPSDLIEMSRIYFEMINTHVENSNQGLFRYFDHKIATIMEEMAISLESYAEILALTSNKDFVSEVKRELDSVSVKSP